MAKALSAYYETNWPMILEQRRAMGLPQDASMDTDMPEGGTQGGLEGGEVTH